MPFISPFYKTVSWRVIEVLTLSELEQSSWLISNHLCSSRLITFRYSRGQNLRPTLKLHATDCFRSVQESRVRLLMSSLLQSSLLRNLMDTIPQITSTADEAEWDLAPMIRLRHSDWALSSLARYCSVMLAQASSLTTEHASEENAYSLLILIILWGIVSGRNVVVIFKYYYWIFSQRSNKFSAPVWQVYRFTLLTCLRRSAYVFVSRDGVRFGVSFRK